MAMGARRAAIAAAVMLGAAWGLPAEAAGKSGCDRACLGGALDQYLAAVMRHDPKGAPLAAGFRETENAIETRPGEGLWSTARGLGAVQRRYIDTEAGEAVYFGLVDEDLRPALVSLRVKVVARRITEAEWIVARKGMALWNPAGLIENAPPDGPGAGNKGLSRARVIEVGSSYFNALEAHDGKVMIHNDGCVRVENGTRMTGRAARAPAGSPPTPNEFGFSDCAANFQNGAGQLSAVVKRHFLADVEQGVAIGWGIFQRPPTAVRRDGSPNPRLLLTEFFGLENGKISRVHAAMHYLPKEAPESRGWD